MKYLFTVSLSILVWFNWIPKISAAPVVQLNPQEIRFTQQNVRDTFLAGLSLADFTAKLEEENGNLAKTIQPIHVFTIREPQTGEVHIYSLDNKRLYGFKKAHVNQPLLTIPSEFVEFSTVSKESWKFTSETDGESFPKTTRQINSKRSGPSGLLLEFKNYIDEDIPRYQKLLKANWHGHHSETIDDRLSWAAQESKFCYNCDRADHLSH